MTYSEKQSAALEYYEKRYTIIGRNTLFGKKRNLPADPGTERKCRFCGKSKPEVTFKSAAHAVSELLGNKVLFSMNECDDCNLLFGKYETDLANWFGPLRTVSQIRGKGIPTYKDKEKGGNIRIEMGKSGLEISTYGLDMEAALNKEGPFVLKMPTPTPTKPYIPLNAAKALVKIACSLCPYKYLYLVQPAMHWLTNLKGADFSNFPVLFAFTPGPNPYNGGRVILLHRKTNERIPSLWCIVATSNFRFQFFVPFCPSDKWSADGETTIECPHFPLPFDEDWPHGKTKFEVLDWAGGYKEIRQVQFAFQIGAATKL